MSESEQKEQLKKTVKQQYLNELHKDDRNAVGLGRLIMVENSNLMARYGWQFGRETIGSIFHELTAELFGKNNS